MSATWGRQSSPRRSARRCPSSPRNSWRWNLERLADAVRGELSRFGTQAEIGRIADAWPVAVGEQIARNAWPARIARDGTLHVSTSSSAWAFELTQLEAAIREKLGELAPPKLRFAPGPLPEPPTNAEDVSSANAPEPSAADRVRASELAAGIADEKLRNLVARAAAASLAGSRSRRSI
ncbi:MAG: DciA family protein [Gaiellaceae bacterium]